MAADTIAFLDEVVGRAADLVGHSDGAFVAMLVAMQRPELVNRLVMISGGYDKSGEAMPEMELDVDQVVQFLGSAYGEVSPDGEAHLPVVAAKIGEMMKTEPHLDVAELAKVRQRSLVMFSDDDLMTLTHAVDMYDALPNAELALVNAIVLDFLTNDPVPTVAAIRRDELAGDLPVSRPAVSQHLKVLKDAGLVIDRQAGNRRIYQLNPDGVGALRAYLDQFWNQALVAFKATVEQGAEEAS